MESNIVKENKLHVPHKLKDGRQMSLRHNIETGKLRHLLREKCRIRIKEARERSYNQCRSFPGVEKDWVYEVIREGIQEFEENILLEEVLYNELVEESYKWLIEHSELELNYLQSFEGETVVCPICQKSVLKLEHNILRCVCGLCVPYRYTLDQLGRRIGEIVVHHGNQCDKPLCFFIEPLRDRAAINAICDTCDYIINIIE